MAYLTEEEDPFKSYLFATSQNPDQKLQYSQPDYSASDTAAKTALAAGTMPFMLTPTGAAVGIGSQLVMGYLQQKAADERAKRQKLADIALNQGQSEANAFQNMSSGIGRALS